MNRRQFLTGVVAATLSGSVYATSDDKLYRRLRWSLTLENPQATRLSGVKLWTYVPTEITSVQAVRSLNVSETFQRLSDSAGNRLIQITFSEIPPFANRAVSFDVLLELTLAESPLVLIAPDRWLNPEPYVESDDFEISSLAMQLKRESKSQTVREIYDWVRQNIKYAGYIAEDLGARYAMRARKGDCSEYAYLVAALSRAAGIPARAVGGYVVDRDEVLRPTEYHNWAEVYYDGTWHCVDAQKQCYRSSGGRYVVFEIISSATQSPMNGAHRAVSEGGALVHL